MVSNTATDATLEKLRQQVREVRAAIALTDEYLLTVGSVRRQAALAYANWLRQREAKLIKRGQELRFQQKRLDGL